MPLDILADKQEVDAHPDGADKVVEGQDGAAAVNQPGVVNAAVEGHQGLRPGLVAELERQAGQ